ncbi:MAG: hypothetical protein ACR5LG_09610 [Sodalis sp. (in: enterobacteria)]|uniref:hypothetical protein n=1 Tax=Sodalis sp. (in: enterobacteria) TaxID=1898979 RepID=UPI003F321164
METSPLDKRRRSGDATVWFGLVWFGLVWFGLVWFGLVWFGLVWFGLAIIPLRDAKAIFW